MNLNDLLKEIENDIIEAASNKSEDNTLTVPNQPLFKQAKINFANKEQPKESQQTVKEKQKSLFLQQLEDLDEENKESLASRGVFISQDGDKEEAKLNNDTLKVTGTT